MRVASYSEKVGNSANRDYISYIILRVFTNKKLYSEALRVALVLQNKQTLPSVLLGDIYSTIGAIYLVQKKYDSSLKTLLYCLHNFIIKDAFVKKSLCNNIAISYFLLNRVKEAEPFFEESIAISKSLKDTIGEGSTYTNIANLYYNNYQDALAERYFKKAYLVSLLTNDYKLKQEACLNMAVVAENKKDYLSAINYRKQYEKITDSLNDRDNIWGFAQEKNKLDSELNARKIQLAQQANKVQALELSKQRQQLYLALAASAAFLSFLAFALYAYRNKIRQNKIITAQREELDALNHTKDQLFSVVAHDLRSPVQTMKLTLTKLRTALTNNSISQAEQVAGEIDTISNTTYSLLNNLLYWALSQTGQLHFAKDKLNVKRIVDQVLYDYVPVAAAKSIDLVNEVVSKLSCSGDMNTLKIILRNLIDNAIKFSEPSTKIVISAKEENSMCLLAITDSGKGIDPAIVQALNNKSTKRVDSAQGKSTGIGLWLVKTMSEKNGGHLQIDKLVNGTRMIVHLPKYREYEQAQNTNS